MDDKQAVEVSRVDLFVRIPKDSEHTAECEQCGVIPPGGGKQIAFTGDDTCVSAYVCRACLLVALQKLDDAERESGRGS